ncbi:hypothetical protein [Actinocorallia sp. A-T 12471]|uniref:hypothetical protein n=1 Tax=Actinocorallia sp. A-T 12471 TaxID=3089813 RepID=UPI0029D3FD20|nr:hypothetical protein [Actinocorallia sp. A-T 12471]MDX6742458.1 hypothetical protein [Actinocorallia sp. A-T 12471]
MNYLAGSYSAPVSILFFRYFEDDGRRCLARSWLVSETKAARPAAKRHGTREEWNGQDWYVSFGEESEPLNGSYRHANGAPEYAVPVRWTRALPREKAIRAPGLFANQNSACRLRNSFTIETLTKEFELDA